MRAVRVIESAVGAFLNDLVRMLVRKYGRYLLIGAAVLVALFLRWWSVQGTGVRVLLVASVLLVAALLWQWRRGRKPRRKPVLPDEPTQVLYRWWEPTDLPDGEVCYCGKPRRAGELVYIGITGAHRSRELDEDRRSSCWWRPGLVGTQETYLDRDAVEDAEARAIRSERPRENRTHNRVWA